MTTVPVCLVGCGGMGSRHVQGFARLQRSGLSNVRLVAVCDVRADNAERVAGEAEQLLGYRPKIHLSIDEAVADPEIAAFDVVTEAFSHLSVVLPALRVGKHVLCEKPLALTVRSCQALIDAAKAGGAMLATAENYRRDPTNRLAKAVIDSGVLGPIHLMVQTMIGGNDRIIITPWRHFKDKGAIGLDMGAHLTDIVQYYFGAVPIGLRQGLHRRADPSPAGKAGDADRGVPEALPRDSRADHRHGRGSRSSPPTPCSPACRCRCRTWRRDRARAGTSVPCMAGTARWRSSTIAPARRRSFTRRTVISPARQLADKIGFKLDQLTQTLYGGVSYELPWAETDSGAARHRDSRLCRRHHRRALARGGWRGWADRRGVGARRL